MGFRFRKSVKICKGVRVNFSRSGASLSLGGRGHSVTIGSRSRITFGIPGTGLSYSTSLSGGHRSHHRRSSGSRSSGRSSARQTVSLPNQVNVIMSDDGKIELRDGSDMLITDPSVVRKIKATDNYKNMVQQLERQRQQKLEEIYNESRIENENFIEIYKESPKVDRQDQYIRILNSLRPPVYARKEYEIPCPTEDKVTEQLSAEAKTSVTGNIFTVGKRRKEYVQTNLQSRLDFEISEWRMDKERFEAEEDRCAAQETERYNAEFNKNKQYMNELINGKDDVISEAVESWIRSCELPVEINVDYEWRPDQKIMYLDVDLPEIEDIPENEFTRTANGNLKEKKKTQATLKKEYATLVFGLAIFISANIFNVSPAIHNITISGYTQRRNKAGEVNDEYVFSIKFTREIFERNSLQKVDPLDFCMRFENRCNMTSTMLLKKITPYEPE